LREVASIGGFLGDNSTNDFFDDTTTDAGEARTKSLPVKAERAPEQQIVVTTRDGRRSYTVIVTSVQRGLPAAERLLRFSRHPVSAGLSQTSQWQSAGNVSNI
jgi:hypothetical protein